jgi:ERCC4-type nuclease
MRLDSMAEQAGIEIDRSEPLQALTHINHAVPAVIAGLNEQGWADYRWTCNEGVYHHWERKTWQDLTSGLDRIEHQLRQQMVKHPEARLGLLVEGVAQPSMMGTQIYTPAAASRRDVFYANREQQTRFGMVMAWLYQVEKYMEVHYTSTLKASCGALVAFYQSDQKEEHSTFARYLKTLDWHPNPQVSKLIAIGDGIGPAKAEAIVRHFGTVWNVMSAKPEELQKVAGLGRTLSLRLLRGIGRTDI